MKQQKKRIICNSSNLIFSNDFKIIVSHCTKKLECKKEKWRKILKVKLKNYLHFQNLFLIEHILRVGSPNFVEAMRSEMYKIKNLNSFTYIDTTRADKGETSNHLY